MSGSPDRGWQPDKGSNSPLSPPAPNRHRGQVPIEIAGKIHYASINYDRAAQLITLFSEGQDGSTCNFGQGALASWLSGDFDKISAAISILTGLSVEEIYNASPAWEPTFQVISEAYNLFYFGPDGPPKEEEKDQDPLAKGQSSRMRSFWSGLGKLRLRRGSVQVNSGRPPSTKSASTSAPTANAP